MKKPLIIGIIIALVVAGLGYFLFFSGDDEDESTTPATSETTPTEDTDESTPPAQTSAVTIANRAYGPKSVSIKAGTTVTWTNQDSVQHDVTPDEDSLEFERSELLSKGASYSVTFNTPGTYTYHCTPHPDMTGTIVVTE